jgi:hypothetical protein
VTCFLGPERKSSGTSKHPPSNAMSVTIRRANPDDVNAIASILLEAFEGFRPLYIDGGFAATTPSASIILARLEEGPSWVDLLDNQILGTVSAVATSDGLYVRSMGVTPSARGTGSRERRR